MSKSSYNNNGEIGMKTKNNNDNYTLPHNIEAEKTVLCSIINNYNNDYYTQLLAEDDFYVQSHRIIYSTIIELHNLMPGLDIDYYSISTRKKRKVYWIKSVGIVI